MQKVISLRQMAGIESKPTARSMSRVMSKGALAALQEDIPDVIAATVEAMVSGADSATRAKAALELGQHDVGLLIQYKVFDALKVAIVDKSPEHREGAMLGVAGLCETRYETAGHPCEPYLVDLLSLLLDAQADAKEPVRLAADKAARTLVEIVSPHAMGVVLPVLFEAMTDIKKKWQTRRGGLVLLGALAHRAPSAIAESVPAIIPVISECMRDVRKEVVSTAEEVMFAVASVVGNRDIEPFIPALISAISRPKEIPECVHQLSATTFVQQVDAATLAVIVPVLVLGLREPAAAIKRKAVVIVDNMCKLVGIPEYIEPFLPLLAPGVEKVMKETPDPEVRSVAERSYGVLMKSAGTDAEKYAALVKAKEEAREAAKAAAKAAAAAAKKAGGAAKGKAGGAASSPAAGGAGAPAAEEFEKTVADIAREKEAAILTGLTQELHTALGAAALESVRAAPPASFDLAVKYVATLAQHLVKHNNFNLKEWHANAVTPYLAVFLHESEAEAVCGAFIKAAQRFRTGEGEVVEEADDGEDLCNVEFSLGYGGKILLNTATLHVKRGRRYALVGPNGCGKSTLMRAIANGQVEGFPPADVLKTVYVEHDIQADLADLSVLEYVKIDPALQEMGITEAEAVEALASVGFSDTMRAGPLTALSGGWKMKLALARAMLRKADMMLLDEPTNHLDVTNVKWLTDYLNSLTTVTSLIVSHDALFLDNVVSDVIAYEGFKLRRYRGNLTEFVKVRPEAKAYYSLDATNYKFSFPEPGYLEGVKTKDKAILKMIGCTFAYPGSTKNTLNDVTLYVTLSSRIAVTGANGAGKSTLIKLLTGELLPGGGSVWKHPNARVAYLAQHAFHHIEEHLDATPSEYIQWRFASGEDRESFEKASRQITEEEEKKMAQVVMFNGQKLVVEQVLRRRKLKGGYEYEVQWVGQPEDKNVWLTREQLTAMGFGKNVDAIDAREAAAAGAHTKPLTAAVIAKHLTEVGLDQEFTLHHRMRGLSGGQKVKVVLGAAMWQNPHILVLDEPSNYLDRDSLGALAGAIKEFGGGVVIISHNREFTDHICKATWHVADGRMTPIGEDYKVATVIEKKAGADEFVDAAGNVTVVKKKQVLSRSELKKKLKERKTKIAKGEDVSDNEELDAMLEAAEAEK